MNFTDAYNTGVSETPNQGGGPHGPFLDGPQNPDAAPGFPTRRFPAPVDRPFPLLWRI